MRVLIVDDEPAARRRLALMLEELDIEVAGEASNGVEALSMVTELHPDVLLLDIQMREVSGLDVARHLEEPRPIVIFQTAFDAYAVEAFEHAALDYLLKPVALDRLRVALDRARGRLGVRGTGGVDAAIAERLERVLSRGNAALRPRILVRDARGHRLLNVREVLRFGATTTGVSAFLVNAHLTVDFTLDELERRYAGTFVRVSRSELVNIDAISHVRSEADGGAILTLADGTTVRASRRRAADVRRLLQG